MAFPCAFMKTEKETERLSERAWEMAHSDVYSYSPIIKDHPSPPQLHLTITTSQRPSSYPITLEIRAPTHNLGGGHKHSVCNWLSHFFLFSSFIFSCSFLSILLRFVHVIVYLLSITFYCWLVFFCIRIPQFVDLFYLLMNFCGVFVLLCFFSLGLYWI